MSDRFTLEELREFESVIATSIPGFRVAFKDESSVQKLIGFFMRPINDGYMTHYTSTFYPVVWFPSKSYYESNPEKSFGTLAHEFVHLTDTKSHKFWFRFSYLCPQVLGLVPLIAYQVVQGLRVWAIGTLLGGALIGLLFARFSKLASWIMIGISVLGALAYSFIATGWWALLLLAGLVFFAPWSSPWRTYWEIRGYTVQVALAQWQRGALTDADIDWVVQQFTGSGYYFMSRNRGHVLRCLREAVEQKAASRTTEPPYDVIYKTAVSSGIISS